jgi:hypothetical protein
LQQQEQELGQQQGCSLRRSSRRNLGQMGSSYAAVYGPTMGAPSAARGTGGRGSTAQPGTQQPLTPVMAAPTPQVLRRGRGRKS